MQLHPQPHQQRQRKARPFNPIPLPPQARALFSSFVDALEKDWHVLARPSQLPPPGDWRIWLLMAGRGFGKTRSGAEYVRSCVEAGSASRIALVAPTAADARDVMIEGESGLLAISPDNARPLYEPSKRRLTWPNGAMATIFSADEPDRRSTIWHGATSWRRGGSPTPGTI